MRLFLDTEFASFRGSLISMALVGDGCEWYEVREIPADMHPWVRENVLPVLGKTPIGDAAFRASLRAFLSQWSRVTVVADWTEDLAHFFDALAMPDGNALPLRVTAELIDSPPLSPEVRHNALSDAKALRLAYV